MVNQGKFNCSQNCSHIWLAHGELTTSVTRKENVRTYRILQLSLKPDAWRNTDSSNLQRSTTSFFVFVCFLNVCPNRGYRQQ